MVEKRIVLLRSDGTSETLDHVPSRKELSAIVGGYIEMVRVMDRIEDGLIIHTAMIVNEEGLLNNLPRNAAATAIYQRNVRAQFPDAANPFRAATEEWLRSIGRTADQITDLTPEHALAAGYKDDPWIAGDAVFFEGYTFNGADNAIEKASKR